MIEITNLTKAKIDEELFKKIGEKILTQEKKEKKNLSVVLVGPKRIKHLNKKYRKKNRVVSLLSFKIEELGLGEIFLCLRRIKKEAKREKVDFKKKLIEVYLHGILDLLGALEKKDYYLKKFLKNEQ